MRTPKKPAKKQAGKDGPPGGLSLDHQAELLNLAHVLVLDLDGRITFWNKGARELYGYEADEALNRVSHDLLRTRFPAPLPDIREQVLRQGQWQGELRHVAKDGRELLVASHWVLHRDQAGRPLAILEVNNDVTARGEAEERQRQWSDAFRHCALGIGLGHPESNTILAVNPALASLVGATPEELVGQPILGLYDPAEHAAVRAYIAEADRLGRASGETVMLRRDGTAFPVLVHAVSVRDGGGRIQYRVATVQDISQRRRTEQALEGMAKFPEQNPNPVLRIAADGALLYANPAAMQDFPEPAGPGGLAAPPALAALWEQALAAEGVAYAEVPLGERMLRWAIKPVPQLGYVNLYAQDITQLKETELALRASQASYKALADHIPSFISRVDRQLRRVFVNQATADFMGSSPEELRGKTTQELGFPIEEAAAREELMREVFASGQPRRQQVEVRTPRGVKTVDWLLVPEFDERGRVATVLNVAHDVSERVRAQEELARHRDQLEEMVDQRTQELEQKNQALAMQTHKLEELNAALRVLLEQRRNDLQDLETRLTANLDKLVAPHLEELAALGLSPRQNAVLEVALSNLRDLGGSFGSTVLSRFKYLTPREIQVAQMVREGQSSKDIAGVLGLSVRSVDFYRRNLRRKLGLGRKKHNLRTYLLSID